MKKYIINTLLLFLITGNLYSQDLRDSLFVQTDIFSVVYSEVLEQPLKLNYRVECPLGSESRTGIDFYEVDGIHTSDDDDYYKNVWDKGHLAPAAAFNCDKETLLKTFTYLNCALQHEGLNRGPWKELERVERDLHKITGEDVFVEILVIFDEESEKLPTGATVPSWFIKRITTNDTTYSFKFPNRDVKGEDWSSFRVIE